MSFLQSIRFKLSVQYSAVVFGLGGGLVGIVYLGLQYWFHNQSMNRYVISGEPVVVDGVLIGVVPELSDHDIAMIETVYNDIILDEVARFSVFGLVGLFLLSLVVGWLMAGRVLKPIDQITTLAREIEVSDLSRRIALYGPDDELTRLAATIDGMLERLERAFRGQKRFLADTSHDLRTPLAVIRSNVEVALDDPRTDEEEWRETGEIIKRNVEKMGEMIDSLLAVARVETANPDPVSVDLAELVERKAREYQPVILDAGLAVDVDAHPASTIGVELAIERAASNLIDNAIRVAPSGSRLKLASGEAEGWAYLAVDDEGPGLQLDSEELPIGLGLSIVERVADSHGGSLASFSGSTGKGTTMVMWLPTSRQIGPQPNNSPLTNV
ncbi:MAG TPA: histidine kinase dimerization/phospho-acceptor domain-containing protein [Acidimicrobiia bacterium]|nr:histidine kinase dimerization/phospho-acceptor domain-containing protein [Acidimicrobiia bacterium]